MPAEAVSLVSDAEDAAAILTPVRQRLLSELGAGDSAAGLARRVGLTRQQVNYHLRELERRGFVKEVEQRKKGNCVERIVKATARSYLISPEVAGALAADPSHVKDRFSSLYLIASWAAAIKELATVRRRAANVKKKSASFTLQVDVRFATQSSLAAFTEELSNEVARLVAKHHDESAPEGRLYRFLIGAWPAITKPEGADEQKGA